MHHEYSILMSAVLDQEAAPEEVARLEAHLASCPACAATWDRWRSLDICLSSAPMLVPPAGFAGRVAGKIEERQLHARRQRWFGSGLLVAWAASLLALWLAFLGLAGWCLIHPSMPRVWASASTQTLSGLARTLDGLHSALSALGLLPVSLGLGSYLCVTALAAGLWLWLMWHKSGWTRALASAISE